MSDTKASKKSVEPKSEIIQYFHCATCMSGKLAVGFTVLGLQVYCEKCNLSVLNLDFIGQQVKKI